MLSDNMSALHMTRNPVQHVKSKHIEIDSLYQRSSVAKKLEVTYCSSEDQLIDIFPKPLGTNRFQYLKVKLLVVPKPPASGEYLHLWFYE